MPLPHHWSELSARLHTNLCFRLGASIFRNCIVFDFECLCLACCIGSRFGVCCIAMNKLMANCSQFAIFSQIPSIKTSYAESKHSLGCLGNFSKHYCDTVHFIQQISQTSRTALRGSWQENNINKLHLSASGNAIVSNDLKIIQTI